MAAKRAPKPVAFADAAAFRRWLEQHHASETELLLRLFRTTALDQGIGYRDALDLALCFGWIDGVKKSLDAVSFTQRFSPRKRGSRWSLVNIRRAKELEAEGRMHAAGLAAFRARDVKDTRRYSFERKNVTLAPAYVKRLRANRAAWRYYEGEAPWYRHVTAHYVMSAKREETRERRLATLIDCSARGVRIGVLAWNAPKAMQRARR